MHNAEGRCVGIIVYLYISAAVLIFLMLLMKTEEIPGYTFPLACGSILDIFRVFGLIAYFYLLVLFLVILFFIFGFLIFTHDFT